VRSSGEGNPRVFSPEKDGVWFFGNFKENPIGDDPDMKKVVIFSFILLLMTEGSALADHKASSILDGVQKRYKDLPGLTIQYSREVITRTMAMLGEQAQGDMATGTIFFKPPRHLKLQQETPEPETVRVTGDTIWWIIPKKKTAYRYPSAEFGKELELLSDIFSGLVKAKEKFNIEMLPKKDPGPYRLALWPDPPWQEVDRVVLTVTEKYEITGVDIYNLMGGITRFRLNRIEKTEAFPDGFFDFEAPEGFQIKDGRDQ
jgi:outer membrane lipoprotein-sorting protein